MIFIKNLTKKYRSKNKRICTALNKINLTLPDSGMIFVIGKSGSGKSTLLNLIGGLDSFEGGTIIADGNNLSKFRASDFYKYRASYASFIFQDYHLIEELTIKENVKLSLEIEGEKGAPQRVQKQAESSGFDLFSGIEASKDTEAADKIRDIDINTITPIEAMNLLFELKKIIS